MIVLLVLKTIMGSQNLGVREVTISSMYLHGMLDFCI